MFWLKKIISALIYPLPICLEVLVIGLILLLFTRFQKTGKALVAVGVGLLVVISFEPVPQMMARSLEHRHWPVMQAEAVKDVRYIAVLGCGHTSDPRLPINSRLDPVSLARLAEGIRLHRMVPGSKLIFSGGAIYDPVTIAESNARAAESLGVGRKSMILVPEPLDTAGEADHVSRIVGSDPFLLVTSAAHIPRAKALFEKQGARPIPSPTDYLTPEGPGKSPLEFFPNEDNLVTARAAWHEWVGMAWARLRGQI